MVSRSPTSPGVRRVNVHILYYSLCEGGVNVKCCEEGVNVSYCKEGVNVNPVIVRKGLVWNQSRLE